jgi:hypothetical protein
MPADPSLEGRTGEPFTMAVEVGKVAEFARATKSTNPAYRGAPGDRVPVPGTFLQTSAFWQTPESSPTRGADLDLRRILHGGQEFTFHGTPPHSGDVLTGTSRVDRVYEKAGRRGGTMSFVETVTEYRNEAGELVAESRSTLIETSQAAS